MPARRAGTTGPPCPGKPGQAMGLPRGSIAAVSETALLVVVPEAEPLMADLRARHVPAAAEAR